MKPDNLLLELTNKFKATGISTPRLDALVLIEHVGHIERSQIVADNFGLTKYQMVKLNHLSELRAQRQPLAYLVGKKQFWGIDFSVNQHVLIPRPESEDLVETCVHLLGNRQARVVDVGCGSGAIGLSIAASLSKAQITLIDKSLSALKIARLNASKLGLKVSIKPSDLLESIEHPIDLIVANLPYLDQNQKTLFTKASPEINHEPFDSLFADDDGLELYKKLFTQASLAKVPIILTESLTNQHKAMQNAAKKNGYKLVHTVGLCQHYQLTRA